MRVFISWSGEKSRKVAEQLRDWIPLVIQSVRPYFSPEDIEKGTRWSSEIASELAKSEIGIICVTRDNIHADWLLFEAGALSKSIDKAHVCPVLFGISNADIAGPLKQFQTCSVNKAEFLRLMNLINSKLTEHKLSTKVLDRAFDLSWPEFEEKVNQILSENVSSVLPVRSDREIMEEILAISRRTINQPVNRTISLAAIKLLCSSYIRVCNQQIDREGGYQDTLDILSSMKSPLRHILRRSAPSSNADVLDLLGKIEEISTQVSPDEDIQIEEDDEIPF